MKYLLLLLILLTLNYSEENEVVEYQEPYIAQDSLLGESNRDDSSVVQQEQQDSSSRLDTTVIKGYYFLK